jgi:hypothetical protein
MELRPGTVSPVVMFPPAIADEFIQEILEVVGSGHQTEGFIRMLGIEHAANRIEGPSQPMQRVGPRCRIDHGVIAKS